jgi:hypothetical protein
MKILLAAAELTAILGVERTTGRRMKPARFF